MTTANSVSKEELPQKGSVIKNFKVLEDNAFAQKLQEEEFEQYYNGNVLTRRTAQQDFQLAQKLAKKLQGQENQAYHELKEREREDSELATELNSAELAEKERMRENMRKLALEDERSATACQDEEIAWKLQEKYDEKLAKQRQQKEVIEKRDAEIAQMASVEEEQEILRMQEEKKRQDQLSLQAINRLKALEDEEHKKQELLSMQEAKRLMQLEEQKKVKKSQQETLSLEEARRLQEAEMQRKAQKRREEELSLKEIQRMKQSTNIPNEPPPSYEQVAKDQVIAKRMQRAEIDEYKKEKVQGTKGTAAQLAPEKAQLLQGQTESQIYRSGPPPNHQKNATQSLPSGGVSKNDNGNVFSSFPAAQSEGRPQTVPSSQQGWVTFDEDSSASPIPWYKKGDKKQKKK